MIENILCVCKGNTCRSPMMEAFLQNELQKLGMKDVRVTSAGVLKEGEGRPINEFSAKELIKRGLDGGGHESRCVDSLGDLNQFDLILCVTQGEADEISASYTLGDDCQVVVVNDEQGGIPNPWQQGPEVYARCAEVIEEAMRLVAQQL